MLASKDAKEVFGKPARVLVGDPTQASGAGLVDLSSVQKVTILMALFRQAISNEINQVLEAYGAVKYFDITLQLFAAQASILAGLFPEITAATNALTFAEDPAVLTFPSLIVVPEPEYGSAATSAYVWYFPRVFAAQDPGQWVLKTEESLQSGEPFTVSLRTLLTTQDQAPVSLPAGKQLGFRGGKPTGWSFPTGY